MSDFEDNLPFIKKLIEIYERGLINQLSQPVLNREAILPIFLGPIIGLEQSLDGTINSLQLGLEEEKKSEDIVIDEKTKEDELEWKTIKEGSFSNYFCDIGAYGADVLDLIFSGYGFDKKGNELYQSLKKGEPFTIEGFSYSKVANKPVTQAVNNWLNKNAFKVDGYKFDIEKCLNCKIEFSFQWQLPKIELLGELGKLIKDAKAMIEAIKSSVDPKELLKKLCDLYFALKNILCPTSLPLIIAALQALIIKYKSDLIKIRVDWTILVGPIIKALLEGIMSLLENIPRNTIPVLDCLINVLTLVNSYKKFAKDALNKSADIIEGVVNETWSNLLTAYETIPFLGEDETDPEKIKKIQELEKQINTLKKNLNEDLTPSMQELQKVQSEIGAIHTDINRSYPQYREGDYFFKKEYQALNSEEGPPEKNVSVIIARNQGRYVIIIQDTGLDEMINRLEDEEMVGGVKPDKEFLEEFNIGDRSTVEEAGRLKSVTFPPILEVWRKRLEALYKEEDRLLKQINEIEPFKRSVEDLEHFKKVMEEDAVQRTATQARFEGTGIGIHSNKAVSSKKIMLPNYGPSTLGSGLSSAVGHTFSLPGELFDKGLFQNPEKDKDGELKYNDRYSEDILQEKETYRKYIQQNVDASIPAGIDAQIKLNKKEAKLIDFGTIDWNNDWDILVGLIESLKDTKRFIQEYYNALNYALRSLGGLFNGSLGLDIKFGGLILFILDLIRFIRLLIKLLGEDWDSWSCKDIVKNYVAESPTMSEYKIGDTTSNLRETESTGIDKSKDSNQIHVKTVGTKEIATIDFDECDNVFNKDKHNLDDIYDEIVKNFSMA